MNFSTLELCAGAGGQALGLERAGFRHASLVEIDPHACHTLAMNRPQWRVHQTDLNSFDGGAYRGVDLVSAGLPCPPFSVAGRQRGPDDERDLFRAGLRLVETVRPQAVMIENVRGLMERRFAPYREAIGARLKKLGYWTEWRLLNACDFGVPQLRPRVVLVALRPKYAKNFRWPLPAATAGTVGDALFDLMAARGWRAVQAWRQQACAIAPTIVGGSKKHGGPDLGPVRARAAWQRLGVDGLGLATEAPPPEFAGLPKLTVRMVARLQGFPDDWRFSGSKTAAYRQVGNAFPPPVAEAVARAISTALSGGRVRERKEKGKWQTAAIPALAEN